MGANTGPLIGRMAKPLLKKIVMNESKLFEYDIFLPAEHGHHSALQKFRKSILECFGGLTVTTFDSAGEWKLGSVIIKDKIEIWRVLSDRGEAGDNFFKEEKRGLEAALGEQKLLIVRRDVTEI